MKCFCCQQEMTLARKVKIRAFRRDDPKAIARDPAIYQAYSDAMTYRWRIICLPCYGTLDNSTGLAEIPGRGEFNLAGGSRNGRAAIGVPPAQVECQV